MGETQCVGPRTCLCSQGKPAPHKLEKSLMSLTVRTISAAALAGALASAISIAARA